MSAASDLRGRLDTADRAAHTTSMNREVIRQQLSGRGPFVIRTSDGKEFAVPHGESVMVGRHNLILDPMHVVSIRPGRRGKAARSAE